MRTLPLTLSLLLASSFAAVSAAAAGAPKHDASVANLVEYFTTEMGVFYSPKQQIRYENGMMGVFATERIEEGELLCSVPWNATINAGRRIRNPSHLVCDTVRNLAKEMRLGEKSKYGPYVQYLLDQRVGQLPSAWSQPAKDLLRRVLDGDGEGNGGLPPVEATTLLDVDWHFECDGADDPMENNAAMLVIQRAEDDLMVPVYDFYNHRNGDYLNTANHRRSMKSFDVTADKTIEAGEQIYISYNMCTNCGGRADVFGTPDMFRDYGFVEAMPQRWFFFDYGFAFDLQEKEPGSEDGEHELSYVKGGRPKNQFKRGWALSEFRRQIMRLKKLKKMEEMKRGAAPASSSETDISEYEWNAIWQYSDALVNALQHVIWEEEGFDDGDDAEESALNLYESLDEIESDFSFYKVSPIKYTATCDNAEMLQMDGWKTLEEPKSLYQEVLFFDMPDGDVCLEIDLTIQTCAKYRPHYHELVVDIPARYIDTVRRVLFVGGGDSMILAEAFKYPSLELVVGLELDQVIVRNSFKYFHTQPHFEDKRVQWWFGDAVKSLKLLPAEYFGSFDLVLVDLSETVASLSVSDHLDMLQALTLLLRPEGVMIKNEWTYLDKMSTLFKYTARLNMQDVPIMCDQALTMGSQTVDFLNHQPVEHDIKRRLLGPQVDIEDRFHMFHDYQDNVVENGTCGPLDESSGNTEGDSGAGVLMVLNVEDTSVSLLPFDSVESSIEDALKELGFEVLSSSLSESAATLILQEGYVTVRTWPEQNYAAFDIHLWGAFAKHELIRDALLKVVGSADGSWSSYRVVGGGMLGSSTWNEDRTTIGPLSAHAESCSAGPIASNDEKIKSTSSKEGSAKAALSEVVSTIQSEDGSAVVAICGAKGGKCLAQDVLSREFEGDSTRLFLTVWTCDGLLTDTSESRLTYQMMDCETRALEQLYGAVSRSREIGIGEIVIDAGVPMAMVNVINGILNSRLQRWDLLADQASIITLMSDDNATMKRKHTFLDRVRKEIANDPLFRAELVVDEDGSDTPMEIGILTTLDYDFFPRLYNVTKQLQTESGTDVHVRKVLGARWEEQDEDDYDPREYKLEDYDTLPGKEQLSQQKSMGRQSIFQLAANDGKTLSRSDIERALFAAVSQAFDSVTELKTVTEVGKGFVTTVLSPQGSVHLLWDGASGLHINVFSYDESEAKSKTFVKTIEKQISATLIQHDEQPRGTGRVVNFSDDANSNAKTTSASSSGSAIVTDDGGDHPMVDYECPVLEEGSSQNDIAGYFSYYDNDVERHAENEKDKNYYIDGFRNVSFGGRGFKFFQMKEKATEYKAKYYGDVLEDGDWIYEGASGEAFNLLLTLEILAEQRGIKNLRAFGSDYLAESVEVADKLFEAQSKVNPWIKKGKFCQGDSTDLSFVPADTFDLAFTYVDPMVDALGRYGDDVEFDDRVEEMKELCKSDDEEDQDIVAFDQQAQENWHSDWVMELIRITKPGKAIIIEDVDTPVCDESSEWGGVATSWWKFAVDEYGWDVDPDSIEIVEAAWYPHRYNVFMRKNVESKSNTIDKNLSRDDGPITTCPSHYWNEEMHVANAFEYDVDLEVVSRIWAEYEKDVQPHLNTGNSTDDFCLVTPYNPETITWEHDDGVVRSDIKWYSTRNEKTFNKYAQFVDELGLKDLVKGTWIDSEDPTIYAIFFIPRSHSEVHQFHEDWRYTAKTQIMTMLVPINKFDIHLKYYDADDEERGYEYKYGKGIGFAGGFIHTTDIGDGEEEDVLLCVYLGSQDEKIWRIAQNNIGDELEWYNSPIKGFIRNENYPDKRVCQYGAQTKYPWKEGKE